MSPALGRFAFCGVVRMRKMDRARRRAVIGGAQTFALTQPLFQVNRTIHGPLAAPRLDFDRHLRHDLRAVPGALLCRMGLGPGLVLKYAQRSSDREACRDT